MKELKNLEQQNFEHLHATTATETSRTEMRGALSSVMRARQVQVQEHTGLAAEVDIADIGPLFGACGHSCLLATDKQQ